MQDNIEIPQNKLLPSYYLLLFIYLLYIYLKHTDKQQFKIFYIYIPLHALSDNFIYEKYINIQRYYI